MLFRSHASGQVSLVARMVKNLPAVQETQVQSLGQEDSLEKGVASDPVFLLGEFQGQRSLVGCSPLGHKKFNFLRICLSFQRSYCTFLFSHEEWMPGPGRLLAHVLSALGSDLRGALFRGPRAPLGALPQPPPPEPSPAPHQPGMGLRVQMVPKEEGRRK